MTLTKQPINFVCGHCANIQHVLLLLLMMLILLLMMMMMMMLLLMMMMIMMLMMLLCTVDVWSVGCILAELLTGKPLFPGTDRIFFSLYY